MGKSACGVVLVVVLIPTPVLHGSRQFGRSGAPARRQGTAGVQSGRREDCRLGSAALRLREPLDSFVVGVATVSATATCRAPGFRHRRVAVAVATGARQYGAWRPSRSGPPGIGGGGGGASRSPPSPKPGPVLPRATAETAPSRGGGPHRRTATTRCAAVSRKNGSDAATGKAGRAAYRGGSSYRSCRGRGLPRAGDRFTFAVRSYFPPRPRRPAGRRSLNQPFTQPS